MKNLLLIFALFICLTGLASAQAPTPTCYPCLGDEADWQNYQSTLILVYTGYDGLWVRDDAGEWCYQDVMVETYFDPFDLFSIILQLDPIFNVIDTIATGSIVQYTVGTIDSYTTVFYGQCYPYLPNAQQGSQKLHAPNFDHINAITKHVHDLTRK